MHARDEILWLSHSSLLLCCGSSIYLHATEESLQLGGSFHEADKRKVEKALKTIRLHEIKMQRMTPLNLRRALIVVVTPWAPPLAVPGLVEAEDKEAALLCLRSSSMADGDDEKLSRREETAARPGSPSSPITLLWRTPHKGHVHFLLAVASFLCSSTAVEMLPISLGWVGMKLRRDRISVRKFQFGFHISWWCADAAHIRTWIKQEKADQCSMRIPERQISLSTSQRPEGVLMQIRGAFLGYSWCSLTFPWYTPPSNGLPSIPVKLKCYSFIYELISVCKHLS